ncbi:MAG TPA: glycerophosphodiester phosphodiesterase [Thermoleophilaceae bacterium]|jgi:glycerophosphoryl diester phosphodiesterase
MRIALLALVLSLVAAAPAAAAVEIHAHRGGPVAAGVPVTPEDTQESFAFGDSIGADVVELDAKLSSDRVPMVMHDATLDRTTDCDGQISQRTAAELAACHVDVIGTEADIRQVPGATVAIPKLADVLAWAKANDVHLNLEIKNQPTDPDYDGSSGFATAVLDAVTASGVPRDHVLIQSFWPPNLDVAKAAGFRTSFLTLAQSNNGSIEVAQSRGYDVMSPAWPPSSNPTDYVQRAHAAGKPVVPYTFNKADEVQAAVEAGVDGVIANDVIVAQHVIYGVDCPTSRTREASQRKSLARIRKARNRARGTNRIRLSAEVKRINGKRQAAKRLRLKVCTPGA